MRIFITSALTLSAALLLGLAGSPADAKGHDNGFGAGTAGSPDTRSGGVAAGVRNDSGSGSETSYGKSDVSPDARSGSPDRDRSDEARSR